MRLAVRLLVIVLLCMSGVCVLAAVAYAGAGSGGSGNAASGGVGNASLAASSPLVTVGSPNSGEEVQAQEQATITNPEVIRLREESQTKYEHLSSEQAAMLAQQTFPAIVDDPAGGPPRLPVGAKIVGFPTDNVAQVSLAEGRHGVIESSEPLAVETTAGRREPVDLSLNEIGGAFQPNQSAVDVRIPKQLSAGVQLATAGISVTPLDSTGSPVDGAEGEVDGATIVYANTQVDTDTVIKPLVLGFEADTMLRSVESPHQLAFRVGLPQGASLAQEVAGSGPVEVVDEGTVIASISPPSAQDATGTPVPVSMRVSGSTLELTVDDPAGEYEYPIVVDPGFEDVHDPYLTGYGTPTNWLFCTSVSSKCEHEEGHFRSKGWGENGYLTDEWTSSESYGAGNFAEFIYQTQGESHIFEASYSTEESNNESDAIESVIKLENENKEQESIKLLSASKNASESGTLSCCAPGKAEDHNFMQYQQSATGPGNHFTDTLKSASVFIEQEVTPTITPDTKDEYLTVNGEKMLNVLDGENKWMGPYAGAVGLTAEEKGMGVAKLFAYNSGYESPYLYEQNLLKENKCKGVQCPEDVTTAFTYNKAASLPNGRDLLLIYGESAAENVGETTTKVNIDTEPPYNLSLSGLPSSGVVNESELHLQARATDGKAPTPSSGIKSLALGLDGFTVPGKSESCTPGPCSATGEWTLNGEDIGVGKHTLTLVATDNAGNVEKKEYSITVRHASPLAVAPGSVDPITGALKSGRPARQPRPPNTYC